MHRTVLIKETLKILEPKENANYIDATFGEGGLSFELIKYIRPKGKILAFEWDPVLYYRGLMKLREMNEKNIKIVNKNFKEMKKIVKKEKFPFPQGVTFDTGVANWHYEESRRGFSFKKNEPLDMRINPKEIKITAFDIINYASYSQIVEILEKYGEEPEAERITRAIIERRKTKKITSSRELAEIVMEVKKRKKKIHPATQVFMALRVFLNDELKNLEEGLKAALDILDRGGKIIVITFQGLEDKVVKRFIRQNREKIELLTRNVIKPSRRELIENPKSRSAKLRAIRKL